MHHFLVPYVAAQIDSVECQFFQSLSHLEFVTNVVRKNRFILVVISIEILLEET